MNPILGIQDDVDRWVRAILAGISVIADKDLQEEVWLKGSQYLTSAFCLDEAYCQLFDDARIDDFVHEASRLPLSRDQALAIKAFRDRLNDYGKKVDAASMDDAMVLADPEWMLITAHAFSILAMFPDIPIEEDAVIWR